MPRKTAAEINAELEANNQKFVSDFASQYPQRLIDMMFAFRKFYPESDLQFVGKAETDFIHFIVARNEFYVFPRKLSEEICLTECRGLDYNFWEVQYAIDRANDERRKADELRQKREAALGKLTKEERDILGL